MATLAECLGAWAPGCSLCVALQNVPRHNAVLDRSLLFNVSAIEQTSGSETAAIGIVGSGPME
jgi:hypothetical protein